MERQQKESYTEPVLAVHELLRDVTGVKYREKTSDKPGDANLG
ncbi:MAG TPA: hypothetical protein VIU63_05050 [Nitrospira sp.]